MPPPGDIGQPAVYEATFGSAGFDIMQGGYASTVEGNRTVRAIPWSNVYSVVIQRGGRNPMTRQYRALVYYETDFVALAILVNVGALILTTPREQAVLANLDTFARGQFIDWTTPTGATAVDLTFTILQ